MGRNLSTEQEPGKARAYRVFAVVPSYRGPSYRGLSIYTRLFFTLGVESKAAVSKSESFRHGADTHKTFTCKARSKSIAPESTLSRTPGTGRIVPIVNSSVMDGAGCNFFETANPNGYCPTWIQPWSNDDRHHRLLRTPTMQCQLALAVELAGNIDKIGREKREAKKLYVIVIRGWITCMTSSLPSGRFDVLKSTAISAEVRARVPRYNLLNRPSFRSVKGSRRSCSCASVPRPVCTTVGDQSNLETGRPGLA